MGNEDKVNELNQCFTIILNNFPTNVPPRDLITSHDYISSLPSNIVMFVKTDNKGTLAGKFTKYLEVEKYFTDIGVLNT